MEVTIIGYAPSPGPKGGLCIPIYYDRTSGKHIFHTLSEDLKKITDFDRSQPLKGKFQVPVVLPEVFQKKISIGDMPVFIISFGEFRTIGKCMNGFLMGTAEELLPYKEMLSAFFNKSANEELLEIFKTAQC